MLRVDGRYRLQYGNMADDAGAEKTSSPLREIVRNRRALWWTGGAVVLIVLVGATSLLPSDWLMPSGLGAGALFALVILWKVPQWQVGRVRRLDAKERFDRVNEARKTLAQILGGTVLLAGFFGTWQNIKVAQENLTVSQGGQIADRFTKAIEQLGALDAKGCKKLEVRLGGIYALGGIADESARYHWPVVEVLSTYVRMNAPLRSTDAPLKPQKSTQECQATAGSLHPDADIQAILTVLGGRDHEYEQGGQFLDLRDTYLRGADLREADLREADLQGADLREADLSGANLREAYLSHADLGGADLTGADLRRAIILYADLSRADLQGADLRDALNLTQEQINAAMGDGSTRLPSDLHMPESWKK